MSPRVASTSLRRILHGEDGWGWCIVTASFVAHVIAGGISYSGGVWLMILRRYFERSRRDAACLGAILLAMTSVGGVLNEMNYVLFVYKLHLNLFFLQYSLKAGYHALNS